MIISLIAAIVWFVLAVDFLVRQESAPPIVASLMSGLLATLYTFMFLEAL